MSDALDHTQGETPAPNEAEQLAAMRVELARTQKFLIASERWREAYQDGKMKMYSMGGAVADAAMDLLPCNEGQLDRFIWGTYRGKVKELRAALDHIRAYVEEAQTVLITRDDMHDHLKAQTFYDEAQGLYRLILSEVPQRDDAQKETP